MARSAGRGNSGGDARVGATTRITGRVSGEGNLLVEGRVEGNVSLRGELRVASGGSVAADTIEAEALHVASGAQVRGNVVGGTLSLDDGAQFDGRIDNEFSLPSELEGGAERPRRR